ncbi:hypothetical protein ACVR1G_03035 [Streptococcus dentasini]
MEFSNLMANRHSTRHFKDQAVETEMLKQIVAESQSNGFLG